LPSEKHESLLKDAARVLEAQGFRVIRLDKRNVPDMIALRENSAIAVEVDVNPTNIWLTRRKFEQGESQYDEEIIVTEPYSDHYHTKDEYLFAIEARKQGKSYLEIRRELRERFQRNTPISLIYKWVKGKSKPLSA